MTQSMYFFPVEKPEIHSFKETIFASDIYISKPFPKFSLEKSRRVIIHHFCFAQFLL